MTNNMEYRVRDFIEIDGNGFFICPFCGEPFKALAYHTRQVHSVDAVKLRKMFNLPQNYPLQTKDIILKRREKALYYNMDKQLIAAGTFTRFKKGCFREETRENIRIGHMKNSRKIIGVEIL